MLKSTGREASVKNKTVTGDDIQKFFTVICFREIGKKFNWKIIKEKVYKD